MSVDAKILPHYTYNEWVNWEGRWEIIDGIPYAMSPMPVPKHQSIASNLGAVFFNALRNCKKCKPFQAIDYKVSEETIVQPDFLVVSNEIEKSFLDFPPALVIEILSPSTALKDRHTKFGIYEKEKVGYYLIIDPQKEEIEIYLLNNKGAYELALQGKNISYTFAFEDEFNAVIDFAEIW
jgi:Uma2 family endonuclease